ncbi:hypothetical protein BDZ97DRAFT_1762159 [Flammula alnicola]|nr:hypothetical protein BDZ97DRAFT_1762159 [Flammula alnicola]
MSLSPAEISEQQAFFEDTLAPQFNVISSFLGNHDFETMFNCHILLNCSIHEYRTIAPFNLGTKLSMKGNKYAPIYNNSKMKDVLNPSGEKPSSGVEHEDVAQRTLKISLADIKKGKMPKQGKVQADSSSAASSASTVSVRAFYKPSLLPDYNASKFQLAGDKLQQHEVYNKEKKLILAWGNLNQLHPGTLIRVLREAYMPLDVDISFSVLGPSNVTLSKDAVNAFNDFTLEKKTADQKTHEAEDRHRECEHTEIKKKDKAKKVTATASRGRKREDEEFINSTSPAMLEQKMKFIQSNNVLVRYMTVIKKAECVEQHKIILDVMEEHMWTQEIQSITLIVKHEAWVTSIDGYCPRSMKKEMGDDQAETAEMSNYCL